MEIVDQIRQTANIIEIASQYTDLKQRGGKHVGLCPFHSEKTPSFTLDEDKQLFHCFGCGAGGDIFTLVMEKENLSFPEALRYLAEKYKIPLPEKKRLSPQSLKLEDKLYEISQDTMAYFRKNLFNTKEGEKALDYLEKRNISHEWIQEFKIGYALNSWDSLLAHFQKKGYKPELLEKAGLALKRQNKTGFYDRFRGRIIFPIFTLSGKTVAFGGRTIFDEDPKYLNSPDTLIYSKGNLLYGLNFTRDKIRELKEIILVEGYTDFLSLFQSGIENIAASLGTSLTAHQVALATRFAPVSIISYDGDIAGRKAALRAISLYFEKGAQVKILLLPDGLDPDAYIRKYGPDKFIDLGKKSIPGFNFLLDSYTYKKRMDIPEVKAGIAKKVIKEIEKIPDPFIRSDYITKISENLSIDENEVRAIIKNKTRKDNKIIQRYFLPAEKRLLQIIFDDSRIAALIFQEIKSNDYMGLKGEAIFIALEEFFKEGKSLNFPEFKQKLDSMLFQALSEILQEKSPSCSTEEAKDCLFTLKQYSLEIRRKEIKIEIAKWEKNGKTDKIVSLLRQNQAITEELSKQP